MGYGGSRKTSDQSVGGTGRDAEPPGEQVPQDGRKDAAKDHPQVDLQRVGHLGNRIRDVEVEYPVSEKIETAGPDHGLQGSKYFGGNYGGNGAGRIMKTVDHAEDDGQGYNNKKQSHRDVL